MMITDEMVVAAARAAYGDHHERYQGLMRKALNAAVAARDDHATHRHKKRGTDYVLLGIGLMQSKDWRDPGTPADNCPCGVSVNCREVAIYRSVDKGWFWVRPREEFEDGRFQILQVTK